MQQVSTGLMHSIMWTMQGGYRFVARPLAAADRGVRIKAVLNKEIGDIIKE
jgi:hypothetical protein